MMKEAKIIQSRLSRRGVSVNLSEIREHLASNGYSDSALSEDQISQVVESFLPTGIVPADEPGSLSQEKKQEFIQQVASNLDISLSLDNVKEISQKLDWALSDRASIKSRIQAAIIAWIDFKVDQDKLDTDRLIQSAENHFSEKMQQAALHFDQKTSDFSNRVGQSVKQFRSQEDRFLNLFKIPG